MSDDRDGAVERIRRRQFLAAGAGAAAVWAAGVAPSSTRAGDDAMPHDDLRQKLLECLGGPWPQACPLEPRLRETTPQEGYRIESVTYEVEPGDRVPALVLVPDGVDADHPAPAVAVWHQHNGQWHLGKSEPAGLDGNPMHFTGVALAKEGYVVLCPDALSFEERQSEHLKAGNFERFEFLRYVVAGKCVAWKNILDMRRAVDYLCTRPEVRRERIGCYGHSMGSTHTWLVGPWEPRLRCLVGNCCLPTYAAIHRTHILHCFPNFVPGWFEFGDTPEIAGLIAPRALHLNFGELDGGSPLPEVRDGVWRIARMYDEAGAADRFTHFIQEGVGHVLSDEMWARVREFFATHLKS